MGQYVVRSPADLQSACSAAQAGDEILIHGGLYAKPSVMEARNGTADHPISFPGCGTINGYPGDRYPTPSGVVVCRPRTPLANRA